MSVCHLAPKQLPALRVHAWHNVGTVDRFVENIMFMCWLIFIADHADKTKHGEVH